MRVTARLHHTPLVLYSQISMCSTKIQCAELIGTTDLFKQNHGNEIIKRGGHGFDKKKKKIISRL